MLKGGHAHAGTRRNSVPIVSAKRVTKRFGTIVAVDDLSVSVGDGEIVALLGPNGAGKSTLIRMIVGLIRPDQGTVERAFDKASPTVRGKLGYLPEERGLYQDMPILRTLAYFGGLQGMPPRQARQAAGEWLERLGLGPRGSEKVKALSKGNQQKLQFAAAILHGPRLAILDEPFSALDPVNQEVFLDLVRELRDGGRPPLMFLPAMFSVTGFLIAGNPDSTFARIVGLIPLTSMAVMPARVAVTEVPAWELALSAALLLVGTMIARRAAGKVFSVAMLMYGKEPGWREITRWVRES